jgi:hypothetical protein
MQDERIKLSLDLGESSKDASGLSDKLDILKKAAEAVGGEFGALVTKSAEAGKSIASIANTADEADVKTKASLGNLAEKARGLFDSFKAGDLANIGSSVASLVGMVPALAPFAVGIAAAGSAAAVAWPILKDWWEYLEKLNGRLKEQTKGLNDYVEAQRAANEVMKETDALTKAREADKAAKATPADEAKERAKRFNSGIAGNEEAAMRDVTDAFDTDKGMREAVAGQAQTDYQQRMDAIAENAKKNAHGNTKAAAARNARTRIEAARPGELARRDQERDAMLSKLKSREAAQAEAEELMAKAKAGDAGAIDELQGRFGPMTPLGGAARNASPEQIEMEHDANLAIGSNKEFRAGRQRQEKEKAAAYGTIPGRIASDIAAHDAKAIDDSHNRARGVNAQHEAEEEASSAIRTVDRANIKRADHEQTDAQKRHAAAMKDLPGPNKERDAAADAASKARYEALLAEQRSLGIPDRGGPVRTRRKRRFLQGPNPGRPHAEKPAGPTLEQERSSPAANAIGPMTSLMESGLRHTAQQTAQITQILQRLRQMDTQNGVAIASNRSGASNGTI